MYICESFFAMIEKLSCTNISKTAGKLGKKKIGKPITFENKTGQHPENSIICTCLLHIAEALDFTSRPRLVVTIFTAFF